MAAGNSAKGTGGNDDILGADHLKGGGSAALAAAVLEAPYFPHVHRTTNTAGRRRRGTGGAELLSESQL
jgi:hypothetical protein